MATVIVYIMTFWVVISYSLVGDKINVSPKTALSIFRRFGHKNLAQVFNCIRKEWFMISSYP